MGPMEVDSRWVVSWSLWMVMGIMKEISDMTHGINDKWQLTGSLFYRSSFIHIINLTFGHDLTLCRNMQQT